MVAGERPPEAGVHGRPADAGSAPFRQRLCPGRHEANLDILNCTEPRWALSKVKAAAGTALVPQGFDGRVSGYAAAIVWPFRVRL